MEKAEEEGMLICGEAREIPLADESVQCCVTSPPYWGLRRYSGKQDLIWGGREDCAHEFSGEDVSSVREETTAGKSRTTERFYGEESRKFNGNHQKHFQTHFCIHCCAWRGAFGLEPTVEMYVQHTVEILRESRRVLRRDGVVFWNIGDSYASTGGQRDYGSYDEGVGRGPTGGNRPAAKQLSGIKPKDLCLIPARVALAAQADVSVRNGREEAWWVRSLIIWAKPNPMPESVTDRPTDAYEHILMLTKSERYFWNAEAVKEKSVTDPDTKASVMFGSQTGKNNTSELAHAADVGHKWEFEPTRNLRNVWTFPTQPYSGAHFATFPEEIPRRCILAATSARGACVQCGAPWERLISREDPPQELRTQHNGPDDGMVMGFGSTGARYGSGQKMQDWLDAHPAETVGWQPTCECEKEIGRLPDTRPCLVLDPFGGSGTTGRVAIELNRRAMLLDLAYTAEAYAPLAQERLRDVQREMFA